MPRGPLRQIGPKLGPAEPPVHGPPKPMSNHPRQPIRPGPTEQLPMFMRANDLIDTLTHTVDWSSKPVEEVMSLKLDKAKQPLSAEHGSGVYDAVAKEGVLNPVQLIHGTRDSRIMGQGHHRAASAAEIEYETGKTKWVPVIHTDAREQSSRPYDPVVADTTSKKVMMKDHREWSSSTKAIGEDLGWDMKASDASDAAYRATHAQAREAQQKSLRPPGPNAVRRTISGRPIARKG